MSVLTCTNFIHMYPSVSHSHGKQHLKEIPWKFEELHFHLFALFEACGSLGSLLIYFIAFQEILVQAINPRAIPARTNYVCLLICEISPTFNVRDTTRDITRAWPLLQRKSDQAVWSRTSTRLMPPPWLVLLPGTWTALPVPPWNKSAMVIIPCSSHLS